MRAALPGPMDTYSYSPFSVLVGKSVAAPIIPYLLEYEVGLAATVLQVWKLLGVVANLTCYDLDGDLKSMPMGDYYHHFLTSMSGVEGYSPGDFHDGLRPPAGHISMQENTVPLAYQNNQGLGYLRSFPESAFSNASKPSKGRRKSRRVKCDETRPVCERCRKGNRECVYPDPPAPKGTSSQGKPKETNVSARKTSPSSSNEGDDDDHTQLETIYDDDESEDALVFSFNLYCWKHWSHLPPDFQHHLNYYADNITNYHYSLANDGDEFFSTIMPSLAMSFEPLLYALVGFAAYHATLENPHGQLQDFLGYYNRSVTLLLDCLKRKETNNVPVLVTILQLATIDEFLGDWVNLMGHQKAALEIITKVFAPDTVMHNPVGRACLNWYSRQTQAAAEPDEVRWKVDERSAKLRMISYDMSMLQITQRLSHWKSSWDPALTDPAYLVTDFSYRGPYDPDDIVDPYKEGVLFKPPLFTSTLITAEWHSIVIMHLSQSTDTPQSQLFEEMGKHAYVACAMISLQPCISIAALFLPQDMRHQMWIRRKFALLDILGCIHPTARRIKMAHVFRDPSCARWWLPNDAGLTPILQSIRAFADDRNAAAVNAQQENIREVRHLFAKLEVGLLQADAQLKGGEPAA
ncbi:C6 finger domain-containingprotein [Purpureocillium lavendulum]|uniref:C6 finger domain-containingprotein n=1 Tax=Purpureocillium lavendulum TaxID=1247861 RepID=A0AB34FYZ6_9HYPO|nr:C6 finger domain-containingprotein [Purpureocillium lavendulum]